MPLWYLLHSIMFLCIKFREGSVKYVRFSYFLSGIFPGITANMLDERDVWFIWTTLTSLGLPRATPHLASKLVTSYVAQLDRIGLWDWGIFVAQHLPAGRTVTIRNLIKRNIVRNITDVTALSDEEKRCLQDYHVDGNVFHCARALHARFSRDWCKVVTWYTAAEMFDSAHRILIDKIG